MHHQKFDLVPNSVPVHTYKVTIHSNFAINTPPNTTMDVELQHLCELALGRQKQRKVKHCAIPLHRKQEIVLLFDFILDHLPPVLM